MAKTFIKSKSKPKALSPGFRTPDHFKGSIFAEKKGRFTHPQPKFNPAQFKVQHRG